MADGEVFIFHARFYIQYRKGALVITKMNEL